MSSTNWNELDPKDRAKLVHRRWLMHAAGGNHKYTRKVFENGKWRYYYDTDGDGQMSESEAARLSNDVILDQISNTNHDDTKAEIRRQIEEQNRRREEKINQMKAERRQKIKNVFTNAGNSIKKAVRKKKTQQKVNKAKKTVKKAVKKTNKKLNKLLKKYNLK